MKKILRCTFLIFGLFSIFFFCVSATAGITTSTDMVRQTVSEPVIMLALGFGLIGLGTFIKRSS